MLSLVNPTPSIDTGHISEKQKGAQGIFISCRYLRQKSYEIKILGIITNTAYLPGVYTPGIFTNACHILIGHGRDRVGVRVRVRARTYAGPYAYFI
jgi:hypothetical protein